MPQSKSPLLRRLAAPQPEKLDRILGVDPSLRSTGYAYRRNGALVTGLITTDKLRGPHRLFYVRLQLSKILEASEPTLIVFEDYAMGARGNNMFHIGELGGLLKVLAWERGIDYIEVPPTVMKSVIALNGRADKKEVRTALKVRFGLTVQQYDEADATGLMLLGEMKTGVRRLNAVSLKSDRFDAVRSLEVVKGKLTLISKPR